MDLETPARASPMLMEQHGLTRMQARRGGPEARHRPRAHAVCRQRRLARRASAGALAASMANLPANTGVVALAAAACADAPAPAAPSAAPADAPEAAAAPSACSTADGTPCDSSRVTEVCAPMVGVFYAAPAPGAEPFVRVGSQGQEGRDPVHPRGHEAHERGRGRARRRGRRDLRDRRRAGGVRSACLYEDRTRKAPMDREEIKKTPPAPRADAPARRAPRWSRRTNGPRRTAPTA